MINLAERVARYRPAASVALLRTSQALAMAEGVGFVTPAHIQHLAVVTLAHRLVMDPQAAFGGASAETAVEAVLKRIAVPR